MTHKGRVSPFGYPRIKACSRLPVASRSVPRPSSPLGAKASTRCPSTLEPRTSGFPKEARKPGPAATTSAARQPRPSRRNASLNDIDPTTRLRRSKAADRVITIKTRHRPPPPHPKVHRQRQCRFLLFTMSHNGRRRPAPPKKSSSSDQIWQGPDRTTLSPRSRPYLRAKALRISASHRSTGALRRAERATGKNGGGERVRTDDLRLAKPALSQLSYAPGETLGQNRPGFERGLPARPCWWAGKDLNLRPHAYQARALTN